ncbi:MSHA biogenesis protein MshK [Massilia glaciei]|uniref:MSHA biogenesis protein MshK n=2 Tax=Massilia glaciei TaxID=1524097 RepID=A0A2U2HJL7_9BURK|nr:MSHA biogenesis protein MshK [Massilia glaciei]
MRAAAPLAALCAALALPARAQPMNDPTRPPPLFYLPAGAGAAAAPAGTPQLQSLLISLRPGGRRVAVIDGKTVRQGDRVGGAVLARIESTHVVLRRGGKLETIKLYRPAATIATVQP